MKKQIVIAVLASALMGSAGFAEAGDRDRGYRGGHHKSHAAHRYYGRHERRHRDYYRQVRHRRHHYGYYNRHHDHYKGLKIVAGAALIGGVIHAINRAPRERIVYRTVRPVQRGNYHYRLDTDGQCVEVSYNRQGQEVWTYVDPSYCY